MTKIRSPTAGVTGGANLVAVPFAARRATNVPRSGGAIAAAVHEGFREEARTMPARAAVWSRDDRHECPDGIFAADSFVRFTRHRAFAGQRRYSGDATTLSRSPPAKSDSLVDAAEQRPCRCEM
jgi:hypothetical protein